MSSSHARSTDPRAVVVGGLTTFAWYAVPDVVGPRWARALAKTAVAVAGAALAVGVTRDGARARAELGRLRDEHAVPTAWPAATPLADEGDDGCCPACTDVPDVPEGVDPVADNPSPVGPAGGTAEVLAPRRALAGAAAAVGVSFFVAVGIAGEKLVYRGAEALRARGVRRPHTLVGVGMGVLAAGLSALDRGADEAVVSGSTTPR